MSRIPWQQTSRLLRPKLQKPLVYVRSSNIVEGCTPRGGVPRRSHQRYVSGPSQRKQQAATQRASQHRPRLGTMEPARERVACSSSSRNVLMFSSAVAVVFMATCAATATCARAAPASAAAPSARAGAWRHPSRTSFVPNPHHRLGSPRHRRRSFVSVQAVRPGKEGASTRGRIAVDADSWYLGDGGFADRHLDDEEHIAAKKV